MIVTHSGCDLDAIAAAAALYFSLSKRSQVKILVPDHIAKPAKAFASKMHIPYSMNLGSNFSSFDCLLIVDFNSLEMAGSAAKAIRQFNGKIFLIDHHRKANERIGKNVAAFIDQDAVASCELVFRLLQRSGSPLGRREATCIAAGIVADSAYFLTANSSTFSIMAEALEKSGKSFSELLSLFSIPKSFDQKIAALKAAKRSRIFRLGKYVVATSDVGAFEADAASTLVKIGADIAFVGDSEEGKLRVSGRASQAVLKSARFDLARHVFQLLPKQFPGSGGGHAGAAGFNGQGNDINAALMQCVSLTKQFFRGKKGFFFKEYT
ncbi:MAG: DHH family phosphoesterase [Candidatus Diapherotrites archaeon]|uniref:DHH family phosphoesterase n=1 Tax=Candidatus Iainarchaeum sp. TaxID=3101447 RepID=A0A939C500_9ARCH|nr:DHH family phosphoesterase [Candidatus Diapherotrites archaeon]